MPGVLMTLHHGDFQHVILYIDPVGVTRVHGGDLAGDHADDAPWTMVGEVLWGQGLEVEGVIGPFQQVRLDFRFRNLPRHAVLRHQHALFVDPADIEVLEVVDNHEIPQIPRRNGPPVVQEEVARGVMTGDLHRGNGVRSQGNGLFHDIINVALFQQVVGMLVVGAEHTAFSVLVTEQGGQGFQIPCGGTVPDHDELSPFQLGNGVLKVVALMVGVDPCGDVGVQVVPLQIRRVTVNFLMMGLGRDDFLNRLVVAGDNAHKVHHFRQPLDPGMVIERIDRPVIQRGSGLVQRRGGHAGGQHKPHVHRKPFRGLEHEFNAVGAHHVGDLMGVGDNGSGSVGQDRPGKLTGRHQRAFQMNMGVQKAGQDNLAAAVVLGLPGVASHSHNQALGYGYVPLTDLVGKHIDIGRVFQYQIRRFPSSRRVDNPPFLLQLPVDFPCIAF